MVTPVSPGRFIEQARFRRLHERRIATRTVAREYRRSVSFDVLMRTPIRLIPMLLLGAAAPLGAACPPAFTGNNSAFFYDTSAGTGACSVPWTSGAHVAAINAPQWEGAAHCGECLRVTGPLGTTVVKVLDLCPECPSGSLDLSPEAFAAIGEPVQGTVPIQWERVDCPVSGNIVYRFDGSSAFYLSLQPREHRHGVQSISVLDNGSYVPMVRNSSNKFIHATGTGSAANVQVRVTSAAGEVLDQTFSFIQNDTDIPGSGQFSSCSASLFGNGFE